MIDPLNQLPGQTEKVPGNRKRAGPIYIPVHCTGTFLLSKTNLLLKREVRVGAVRAVSWREFLLRLSELALHGTNVPYCVQVTCTKCITCMKYSYS